MNKEDGGNLEVMDIYGRDCGDSFTYFQTHHVVYIKYIQLLVFQ